MTNAPDPVMNPAYWKKRLQAAREEIRRALFIGPDDLYREAEERQRREIVAAGIGPSDSVLDAACGYGRLLEWLPAEWVGRYVGVDISPEFVALAKQRHPGREFWVGDLRDLSAVVPPGSRFDVGVCVWVKTMVLKHVGAAAWEQIEVELGHLCRRLVVVD